MNTRMLLAEFLASSILFQSVFLRGKRRMAGKRTKKLCRAV
jgi:hypothetical protein